MKTLLFSPDSEFGHVVENSPLGVIYRDDGTLVDSLNLRPCVGCNVKIARGEQDPCIANLPGTSQACCGHGLALCPRKHTPNGYVGLEDGRTFRFLGTVSGDSIRAAVAAALRGELLPEGFTFDQNRMWWEGLTEAQVAYVRQNMVRGLGELVTEAQGGLPPAEAFLAGQAMWHEGLDQDKKDFVMERLGDKIAELVQEALRECPSQ
ncbi:MAG: hypothetical protein SGJ27_03575 [Candidatus Melainabacteria bacterium]|nr:hypothetical protein [Candidatus Melainabacteria bacterium]